MNIKELGKRSNDLAKSKGWWSEDLEYQDLLIASKTALIISEVIEAIEELRKFGHEKIGDVYYEGDKPEGFTVELADAIIRIVDLAQEYNLPLQKALEEKEEYNMTRTFRHGNKRF